MSDAEKAGAAFDAQAFLASLTSRPGVYRMLDGEGKLLYVGKARNLKNRVGSYFRASGLSTKTMAMVARVADIDVTITANETEALLLEQSLIKAHRPPYNIQLRDDKSYPYILLTDHVQFPRLVFYRGSRRRKGTLFGPYPSAHATRDTLNVLQKVFRVRQCEDSYFKNRSRPCLQYQIERCTGPCVGLVSAEDYAEDVRHAILFLQGRSDLLVQALERRMGQAAAGQQFERAARIRDQIRDLRRIQGEQSVANQGTDADILAASAKPPYYCIHALFVRAGRVIGTKNYFPKFKLLTNEAELLSAFIGQHYLSGDATSSVNLPGEILLSHALEDQEEIASGLGLLAGHQVLLKHRLRGHRARWSRLAQTNALAALDSLISNRQNMQQRFDSIGKILGLEVGLERIECFDISHTGGEGTVAACVVFDREGAVKSDYRRFNIREVTPGDDYGAMKQVLERRFARLTKDGGRIPDLLLIDGGKGQVNQVVEAISPYAIEHLAVLGIAKGISRRPGQETLFLAEADGRLRELALPAESAAMHLLQQIRDEAHRFAITGHRQRRAKARKQSSLEEIPGLGPKRRRELLTHFGGQQGILRASQSDLAKVAGISHKLAEVIYSYLHPE